MSGKKKNGGPAFPRPASVDPTHGSLADGDRVVDGQGGMSLRDWFAGQAAAGLASDWLKQMADQLRSGVIADGHDCCADLAMYAYAVADAMIEERGKNR